MQGTQSLYDRTKHLLRRLDSTISAGVKVRDRLARPINRVQSLDIMSLARNNQPRSVLKLESSHQRVGQRNRAMQKADSMM